MQTKAIQKISPSPSTVSIGACNRKETGANKEEAIKSENSLFNGRIHNSTDDGEENPGLWFGGVQNFAKIPILPSP